MAGLNDLITDKKIEATALPNWYDQAQQQTVAKAITAASPEVGQTVAPSAIGAFGAGSPFSAGQDILQNIGSGAANPWLVSTNAAGEQVVSPNVNTAMGDCIKHSKTILIKSCQTLTWRRLLGQLQAETLAAA